MGEVIDLREPEHRARPLRRVVATYRSLAEAGEIADLLAGHVSAPGVVAVVARTPDSALGEGRGGAALAALLGRRRDEGERFDVAVHEADSERAAAVLAVADVPRRDAS